MARANWPRLVASTAAVVSTRVSPWMFPPTICAAPTSLTTAPKPARPAASSGNRASASSARSRPRPGRAQRAHLQQEARVDLLERRGRQRGDDRGGDHGLGDDHGGRGVQQPERAERAAAPQQHGDEQPDHHRRQPIPVLAAASITRRPANRPRASAVPKGTPSSSATAVAVSDTRSVSAVIDQVSSSPVSSSRTASSSPSSSTSIALRLPSALRTPPARLGRLPASGVNSGCPNFACPNCRSAAAPAAP